MRVKRLVGYKNHFISIGYSNPAVRNRLPAITGTAEKMKCPVFCLKLRA